ncbi:MAG: protein TolQ [Alphaproteobacteria bacterium]|nr:protein TolQ [Alphaproteobacteria bacterium]
MASIAAPVTGVNAADVAGTVAGQAAGGHDLSLLGLLLNAEPLVLIIMLVLVGMSIACWAIILEKFAVLRSVNEKTNQFENEFWSAEALDKYYEKTKKRKARHPLALMFSSAMEEWFRSKGQERLVPSGSSGRGGSDLTITVKERIVQQMALTRNREMERLERGLGFLATAGSSAPFIGLLGTTIGIINSFRNIAGSQNTSLAVVAPGIAEALFATSIGLFVAIPAVMAFNKFNGELNRLAGKLEDFSTEFQMLLSRQLDKGGH